MTRRIETILEILAELSVAMGAEATLETIREHRITETLRIAKVRQCDERSVRDTYGDQLQPDVRGVGDFDALVQAWLTRDDKTLRSVLLRHADSEDRPQIERFFAVDAPRTVQQHVRSEPGAATLPGEFAFAGGFIEGATQRVYVNAYERNPAARAACIAHYRPVCVVCGFDFGTVYGPVAEGFIHVHHLKPLSEIGTEYVVDPIADLRPVCPNCHAVIHLGGECRQIDEIRWLLGKTPRA